MIRYFKPEFMKKFYPLYQPTVKGMLHVTGKNIPRRGLEGGVQVMSETSGLSPEYSAFEILCTFFKIFPMKQARWSSRKREL